MPTHDELERFVNEFRALPSARRKRFLASVRDMVADLRGQRPLRQSLRVKAVQGHSGIFEMTWEWPNGRATYEYGPEKSPGERHIIWRRIGGHEIFGEP